MGFPDRYILHPPFDAADAQFRADEPLGAGRVQLHAHNAKLLAARNTLRPLAQHPGWRDFWKPATDPTQAAPVALRLPRPGDIQWFLGRKSGGVTFCTGPHYVVRLPDGRWPTVRFAWRWAVEGGYTAGAVAAVTREGASVVMALASSGKTTTSSTFADESIDIPLSDGLVTPTPLSPVGGSSTSEPDETVEVALFRAWFGAYNSSNTDAAGSRASIVVLSVYLVEPS